MQRREPFGASHWSETGLARLIGPMQQFIHRSASGGIVLLLAAIVALLLANSALAGAFEDLLHIPISLSAGPFGLELTLQHWINDGLMAVFFFVVGLEIKREFLVGELADFRAALLPIIAAAGGAITPALIYAALNAGNPGSEGWGIPMATDIAFAIGVLALLGERVPYSLSVFVTAVAIVDDLIAVLVIAIFYSGGIDLMALGYGFAFIGVLLIGNMFGIRNLIFYLVLGALVWLAFLQSGVHATVAGVLIAATVPARNRIDAPTFLAEARRLLDRFESVGVNSSRVLTDEVHQTSVLELEDACEGVQAPLQKFEHSFHSWVVFGIMPIFALANAGVVLAFADLPAGSAMVMLGIFLGLVLGKPIGLVGISWLAVRTGITILPSGVEWKHMIGAGFLAGIGFTMSLFVATLGFGESEMLDAAKLGILAASTTAGILGFALLSRMGRSRE